jgi:4a-hydroxytetrahydrobiopterin dehydratase
MLFIYNVIIFSLTLVILSLLVLNIISVSIFSITVDSSNLKAQQNSNNNASNTASISITKPINELDIKHFLTKIHNVNYSVSYIRLTNSEITDALNKLPDWSVVNNRLHKVFEFKDFPTMFAFMFKVAEIAQKINHHPNMTSTWNTLTIDISTWNLGNVVSNQDVKFAKAIEQIYQIMFNDRSTTNPASQ